MHWKIYSWMFLSLDFKHVFHLSFFWMFNTSSFLIFFIKKMQSILIYLGLWSTLSCFAFWVDIFIWAADTNLTWGCKLLHTRCASSSVFTLPKDVLLRLLLLWISSAIYFKCHSIGKIYILSKKYPSHWNVWLNLNWNYWTLNLGGSYSLAWLAFPSLSFDIVPLCSSFFQVLLTSTNVCPWCRIVMLWDVMI